MAVGIGAGGVVGLALETTKGTYAPPTKFTPLRSEGLQWQQGTTYRRVIAGTVDPLGAVPGNGHVEGDIDIEALDDVLPYFFRCARGILTKTQTPDGGGAGVPGPPNTYELTPAHGAQASKTMSLTVVRNGVVFGYTGIVVSSMNFTVDDGMLVSTMSLLGEEESQEVDPGAPTFEETGPFAAGMYVLSIPTGTQIFDADGFSFQVEDNGEPQNRLIDRRGAAFISYGERNAQLSIDRDFENRTQYNEFKALTEQSVTLRAEKSVDTFIEFNLPRTVLDAYDVSLGDVGGLIRASATYQGLNDDVVGGAYKITVQTDEDFTL